MTNLTRLLRPRPNVRITSCGPHEVVAELTHARPPALIGAHAISLRADVHRRTELLVLACDAAGKVYWAIRRRGAGDFVVRAPDLTRPAAHV